MADQADMAQMEAEMISEAMMRFRASEQQGESLAECEKCGNEIPKARREAIKACRLCVECQSVNETKARLMRK